MNDNMSIFKINGNYLGFIDKGFLFDRDGVYLGWIEGNLVWDTEGQFRGILTPVGINYYILRNKFAMPPIPRTTPKVPPYTPQIPNPPPNASPISPGVGMMDAF